MSDVQSSGAAVGSLEGAVGERRGIDGGSGLPGPELVERPRRRRFSAEYKLRILREVEECTRPGEVGALCRREGLYSSLLTEWRRARDTGSLEALARPRGRNPRIRWRPRTRLFVSGLSVLRRNWRRPGM